MKAVIYARYSSDKQDEFSITAQVRACEEYAQSKGYHVIKTYKDEAISGKGAKTSSRADYQRLLKDADNKLFDIILVHKYDRIARSLREHVNLDARLDEHGVALVAVAQNFGISSEGKMMRTIMWAMSEYYIDNLSSEVKKGQREKAILGNFNGGRSPFGYDIKDKKYIINDLEEAYVRKMFDCALNKKGYKELIQEMDAAGVRGKLGKKINYSSIYEILRNEKYAGTYTFSLTQEKNRCDRRKKPNAIRVEGAVPQIVSKEVFNEVQNIMDQRKQTGKKNSYMCSGLVYCGVCGRKMQVNTSTRKGHTYKSYRCPGSCGVGIVRMEKVDEEAMRYLRTLLSENNTKLITDELQSFLGYEISRVNSFNKAVKQQTAELQKRIDGYMDTLSLGGLTKEIVEDIGNKITGLKKEITGLQETTPPKDYTVPQIKNWLESLRNTPDEKAIHMLIDKITITKTDISIESTLKSVVLENGCGGGT